MRNIIHSTITVLLATITLLFSGCSSAKLSTANEQMERGEYFDASKTYRKVYNKLTKREDRPLRGEIAFRMGECYSRLNMNARASAAYANAIRYQYPDSTTILRLALSQQAEGKYQAALKSFEDYLAISPSDRIALNGAAGCRMAIAAKGNPTRYVVKPNKVFNSRRADFSPMYFDSSLDQLYFTTTNEKVTGDHRSEITGMKKSDIWFSRKNERGEWLRPEPVEGELNTDMDEGIISFSPDGSTMYLTKARRSPSSDTGVEIYTSTRSDAKWSAAVKLDITADTLSDYGHPAVSPDGKWLYFTSNMPGGQGGRDLWRINLKERAGSLENLGEFI
ncbi:MAG: tetratricopeptide repeat protein, partial [Muribaculaceae bacterium]|nr:tetratricopeptide repeat protein [Muribaculaceae bacterium]